MSSHKVEAAKPRHSKHEQTVCRAIRERWFIEEIEELIGSIEATTIHRIAKRHGLKAKHAPKRPDFMRTKRIAESASDIGVESTAVLFRLSPETVRQKVRLLPQLEKEYR